MYKGLVLGFWGLGLSQTITQSSARMQDRSEGDITLFRNNFTTY